MPIDKDRFHDLLVKQAEAPAGNRGLAGHVAFRDVERYYELFADAGYVVYRFTHGGNPTVRMTAAGYAVVQAATDRGVNAFDLYVEHLFGIAREDEGPQL